MYITAHLVKRDRDPVSGGVRQGINAYYYLHQDQTPPGMTWDRPNIGLIADQYPGTIVNQSYQVPPGGNSVICYLDVVAADSVAAEGLHSALDEFRQELAVSGHRYPVDTIKDIGIRFGVVRPRAEAQTAYFDELRDRLLALYEEPHDDSWKQKAPLVVTASREAAEVVFRFDKESAERVRQLQKDLKPDFPVRIDDTTRHDFALAHGDVFPYVLEALVGGLMLEQIILLGGVRLVDAETGQTVREWPVREP